MKKELIKNFTLGSDPEMFLYSEKLSKFVPVCGLVGGNKDLGIPINEHEPQFTILEDNVALEATMPPAISKEKWLTNFKFVKDYCFETILKPLDLIPMYVGAARFELADLDSPEAQYMGCSTSYSAWNNDSHIVNRDDLTLRTAGMHVHVGYDNNSPEVSIQLIKAMDLFLGVPSVLLDPDTERRIMYGKAGDHRLKPKYGVEYRVLSSYFMSTDELLGWVYDNAVKSIEFVNYGGIITNPEEIIKCINTCDKKMAKEIIEDYKINVLEYAN